MKKRCHRYLLQVICLSVAASSLCFGDPKALEEPPDLEASQTSDGAIPAAVIPPQQAATKPQRPPEKPLKNDFYKESENPLNLSLPTASGENPLLTEPSLQPPLFTQATIPKAQKFHVEGNLITTPTNPESVHEKRQSLIDGAGISINIKP